MTKESEPAEPDGHDLESRTAACAPSHTARPSAHRLLEQHCELTVAVDVSHLAWPRDGAERERRASNLAFIDLSSIDWTDVDEALELEARLLPMCIPEEPDVAKYWQQVEVVIDDAYEDLCTVNAALDLGVGSATFALNAAGCPTSFSCSGHGRDLAWIAFWARPTALPLLIDAANAAQVGLCDRDGGLEVSSDDVFGLLRFARELRDRADAFRTLGAIRVRG